LLDWVAEGDRGASKVHRMMDRYLAKTAKKVAKKRASVKTP